MISRIWIFTRQLVYNCWIYGISHFVSWYFDCVCCMIVSKGGCSKWTKRNRRIFETAPKRKEYDTGTISWSITAVYEHKWDSLRAAMTFWTDNLWFTPFLHHLLFEAWIDDNNNPRLHENVSARVVLILGIFIAKNDIYWVFVSSSRICISGQ